MAINGGIFGGFSGGTPSNTLQFNQGLLPGQVVPSSSAFDPTPILNTFFQPFPYAANSLVTSNMIALSGGGTPLIASYPTLSPFSNSFLNLFNPAATSSLGGLTGASTTPGANNLTSLLSSITGAANPSARATTTIPTATNAGGNGALSGLGGLQGLGALLTSLGL